MTRTSFASIAVLVGCILGVTPTASHAANWKHPYSNVDHSNDAGNNTGDSQVDSLNAGQLDQNYRGPWYYPNGQVAPAGPPVSSYAAPSVAVSPYAAPPPAPRY